MATQLTSAQAKVQRFGRFLSGMIMPNIGAFIAWGLITALFIPTGWVPSERLAALVGPMIIYLLPLLIGFTGGKMVWGIRGGVVGAIVTAGIIVGTEIPMFLGAMIVGPFGGWAIKQFDRAVQGKIPVGFEMLTNNFSAGIIGGGLAILAFLVFAPIVTAIATVLGSAVDFLVNRNLLFISSIFIEPAKILFLNNAINHGVLSPLGAAQTAEVGKSILFMLETNPGPGLGILLAYFVAGKGTVKDSTPGAMIIHFLGGIHEIYFPYVLMRPLLVLAVIAGGASGVAIFQIFGAGLVAPPSPGSIFAYIAVTPPGQNIGVYLGIYGGMLVSTIVSFLVAAPIIRKSADSMADGDMLDQAKSQMMELKSAGDVRKVVFACDAGMGTSAMGANKLKRLIDAAGLTDVSVSHCPVDEVPQDAQIVITQVNLEDRVKSSAPAGAHIVPVSNLVNAPEYDEIVNQLKAAQKK
ncbi:MAG: PTS mannitol transporter subunit IICB [Salinispira sp.]